MGRQERKQENKNKNKKPLDTSTSIMDFPHSVETHTLPVRVTSLERKREREKKRYARRYKSKLLQDEEEKQAGRQAQTDSSQKHQELALLSRLF